MATIGNNMDHEMAFVRDCFFDSAYEKGLNSRINALDLYDQNKQIVENACNGEVSNYYNLAVKLINEVEAGCYDDEDMINVEQMLNYALGKIEDVHIEQTQDYPAEDEGMEQ